MNKDPFSVGPPPPGPLVCFHCVTNTCGHSAAVKQSDVHGGGMMPAVTAYQGTLLCMDCAIRAAR